MKIMKMVIQEIESFVIVYIDDALIFTKSLDFQEHLKHIQQVLERFQKYGFKLLPKKCVFALSKSSF